MSRSRIYTLDNRLIANCYRCSFWPRYGRQIRASSTSSILNLILLVRLSHSLFAFVTLLQYGPGDRKGLKKHTKQFKSCIWSIVLKQKVTPLDVPALIGINTIFNRLWSMTNAPSTSCMQVLNLKILWTLNSTAIAFFVRDVLKVVGCWACYEWNKYGSISVS